jgi:hypothetical protein
VGKGLIGGGSVDVDFSDDTLYSGYTHQVCRIEVLPAIEPESFADTGIEELTQSVHQFIASHVDEHAALAGDAG